MEGSSTARRLTAILSADVYGYSRLMGSDEEDTFKRLTVCRQLVFDLIQQHHGRVANTAGDAVLSEFGSVKDAVETALEIQGSIATLNKSSDKDRNMVFRIGINLGDVIEREGDLFGDGVNIAARLQTLADPGGICVSHAVYEQARRSPDVRFQYLGEQSVKNIAERLGVYKILTGVEITRPKDSNAPAAVPGTQAVAAFDKKRIAVLPFTSISPDRSDEYFADGLTEELISAVSKISDLRTISRVSAMRFKATDKSVTQIAAELKVGAVVEGSVRKAGNQIRISVKLVDTESDEHLWSQDYDRQLQDIFAIQSDIATKVAQALQVHILEQEKKRIEKRATSSMTSYDLYLKGLHDRAKGTEESYSRAIRYFEEALKEDPKFALAYAGLAECYDMLGDEGYLPPAESFRKTETYARKALEIDDSLAEAHATLATVLEFYYYDQRAAEEEFKRALNLNPSYGKVCNSYGSHLACNGRLQEAVSEIVRAQELNPLALDVNSCAAVVFNCASQFDKSIEACERMFTIDENFLPAYRNLAEVYFERARYDDAIVVLRKAVLISNGAAMVRAFLGYAYARAGNTEEAHRLLGELQDESTKKYISPVAFALLHCGLGQKTDAVEWLVKAYDERARSLVLSVKVRRMWASLHSEPAFNRLLERMGLKGEKSISKTKPD